MPGATESAAMADKVYSKPNPQPPLPATNSQLYNRPAYRPKPPPRRRRRCCCFLFIALLCVIFLVGLAGGVFYAIFRPQRPNFSISFLQLSTVNSTASGHLTSRLNVTVTARNPNRKIAYLYDHISISISSNGVGVGEGSFPGFVHGAKSTTVIRSTVSAAVDLKKKNIPLDIGLETKAGMKIAGLKTKKVGIKLYCHGVEIPSPKGKKTLSPSTPDSSCQAKLRVKILKWTV